MKQGYIWHLHFISAFYNHSRRRDSLFPHVYQNLLHSILPLLSPFIPYTSRWFSGHFYTCFVFLYILFLHSYRSHLPSLCKIRFSSSLWPSLSMYSKFSDICPLHFWLENLLFHFLWSSSKFIYTVISSLKTGKDHLL